MTVELWGVQFHLYGLLIGLAVVTAVSLGEEIVRRHQRQTDYWPLVTVAIVGGLLGARLYHVLSAWPVYQAQPEFTWQVWRGGLSIIGALIGGGTAILLWTTWQWWRQPAPREWQRLRQSWWFWADLAALVLPVAQAVGRWGNFFNQELYGPPTTLPWGMPVLPAARLPGYQQFTHFHPLFAYEALGMLALALSSWWWYRRRPGLLGSGQLILLYGAFYGLFRGTLEFWRLDKTVVPGSSWGVNQVLLYVVGVGCLVWLARRHWGWPVRQQVSKRLVLVGVLATAGLGLAGCTVWPGGSQQPGFARSVTTPRPLAAATELAALGQVADGSRHLLTWRPVASATVAATLVVEVVNTPASTTQGLSDRTEIGADGMLFVFPSRAERTFWMPRMLFDIDIVWIAAGEVVGITAQVPRPEPGQREHELPRYRSPSPVDMVLELPAGAAAQRGMQPGDRFELPQL